MSCWPATLTTLATLVANRRCYRENVYRSNRSHRPPRSALIRNYDETRDTPLCAHSPSLPDLTRSQRDFIVSPTLTQAPAPSGFYFGTWSVVKTLENKFPIKQVSAVAAESSQADRTGLAKRPPTVAASRREAYTFH